MLAPATDFAPVARAAAREKGEARASAWRRAAAPGGVAGLDDDDLMALLLAWAAPGCRSPQALARRAIARFGSLAAVLDARPSRVLALGGAEARDVAVLARLVRLAADRLAGADARERPLLNTWDRLVDYLDAAPSDAGGGGGPPLRVLYLDGRNRLLADEPWDTAATDPEGAHREALGRALDLHATALLTLRDAPLPPRRAGLAADAELAERLRLAGAHLSVVLHDHLLGGRARWTSLRRQGLA